ncbi:MAG: flagellin lysine-N-methylase [Oscillospiraceae bacterium]
MPQYIPKEFKILTPDYLSAFACKAGACRNTCCAGWSITLSKPEYLAMKKGGMPKNIEDIANAALHRVRKNATDKTYAEIEFRSDGFCPYLSADRLCNLQVVCGHSALSATCRVFPRIKVAVGQSLYTVLTMGCEAVTEQMLLKPTLISMRSETAIATSSGDVRHLLADNIILEAVPFFDEIFMLTTAILQNKAYTVPQRLSLLSMALENLPEEATLNTDFPNWFVKFAPLASGSSFALSATNEGAVDEAVKAAVCLVNVNNGVVTSGAVLRTLAALKVKVEMTDNKTDVNVSYSKDAYNKADKLLSDVFADMPCALENLVVNLWQHCLLLSPAAPYAACRSCCALYAMLRLAMLGNISAREEHEKADMLKCVIDVVSDLCRTWRHNNESVEDIIATMDNAGYTTAAHMTVITAI